MSTNRMENYWFIVLRGFGRLATISFLSCLSTLTALSLSTAQLAHGQDVGSTTGHGTMSVSGADSIALSNGTLSDSSASSNLPAELLTEGEPSILTLAKTEVSDKVAVPQPASHREQVESDLTIEALASYGHYKIFASGSDCKLYTAGLEYERNSWGRFLNARMDYVGEFLPVVLLYAPVTQDIWGTPTSPNHHIVPGVGMSPIGFRMLWRDKKALKPYLLAKGGLLLFPQKVLSQKATYLDFSLQSAMGVQVKMNEKWDMRLGLFSDFHFSDAFIVPVNPGLDVMNANLGLVYHFGTGKP